MVRIDRRRVAGREGAHRRVVVAIDGEHVGLERQRLRCGVDRECHVRRVAPAIHPDSPLDARVGTSVCPHRHRSVESERLDVRVAGGRNRAVMPARGVEIVAPAGIRDASVEFGEEHPAAKWRRERRDEQAMIAPRRERRDGTGGVTADTVGDQPFPARRNREIAACFPRQRELRLGRGAGATRFRSADAGVISPRWFRARAERAGSRSRFRSGRRGRWHSL